MDKASASGAGDSRLESWAAQGYSEWTSVGEVCCRPNLANSTDQCMEASSATRPRLVGSGSLMSDGNPSSQSKKEDLSPPRLYVFSTERELVFSDKTMIARRQPLSPVES